jgi:hypothetical protein
MLRQLCLCLLILTLRLSGGPLAGLQMDFQVRCDFAEADRDLEVKKLDASYLAALQTQLDKDKPKGNFDNVNLLRDEVLAVKAAKNPLPELPQRTPLELVQMRAKYAAARSKILGSYGKTIATLADQMDGALKLREAELTKAGKNDEALAANQARKTLATDQTVLAAKNLLTPGIIHPNGEGWRSLLREHIEIVKSGQDYVGLLTQAKDKLQKTYLNGLKDPNVRPESIYITHAPSQVRFLLAKKATQVRGKIFLASPSGSVRFKIYADGKLVFEHMMKDEPWIYPFDVKFDPTDKIRIEADSLGSTEYDWSAWAAPEIR